MGVAVGLLYGVLFVSFLNLFWQFPLTPAFARQLTPELSLVAIAVSAYSIANLVGNVFAGFVVDRFPRGPVIGAGLVAAGAALALAGTATGIGALIAALLLNGLALALVTPAAFALLSERLSAESRARGMASSGATIGVAALVGPPVAGIMADRLGPQTSYQLLAGVLVGVGLLALAGLRRTHEAPDGGPTLAEWWGVIADRRLHLGYLGAFVLMYANGSLVFALPAQLKAAGFPSAAVGAMFSLFALAAIAVFVTPLGRKAFASHAKLALGVGAATIAVALAVLATTPGIVVSGVAMLLYGLGFGLIYPSSMSVLVAHAPEDRRGTAFGLFYALYSLGAAVGPLVVAEAAGWGLGPFWAAAAVPAALAMALAAMGLAGRSRSRY